jgi:dipeptidyl-peptidase-4
MIQYSGPNSQQVLDRLERTGIMPGKRRLCGRVGRRTGYGARGEAFLKQTYLNLGVMESDDQVAAGRYLASLPYVDGNRIGIWGWSYGAITY